MTVTRKRHFITVGMLAGIIIILIGVLVYTQFSYIKSYFIPVTKNYTPVGTSTLESYLQKQEVVVIHSTSTGKETILPVTQVLFSYVEIKDSCGVHFGGDTCVVARSGPGLDFKVVTQLRNHVVLKIDGQVEHDGHTWYKIVFDEVLLYPERVHGDWYVAADHVDVLKDEGSKTIWEDGSTTTTKRIIVDRDTQTLMAYEGDTLFMQTAISTGLELSPTPQGTFSVFKKTPSRYMQGPLPGFSDSYDLPGVPWNLYFTSDGAVIHGAYWHDSFGTPYSHGCVNLSPDDARKLYMWADLGTKVIVKN